MEVHLWYWILSYVWASAVAHTLQESNVAFYSFFSPHLQQHVPPLIFLLLAQVLIWQYHELIYLNKRAENNPLPKNPSVFFYWFGELNEFTEGQMSGRVSARMKTGNWQRDIFSPWEITNHYNCSAGILVIKVKI